MAETENKYVKPITIEKKQAIVDTSVQSMNKRPTSDETAMKKRFVQPIVNLDGTPCLADEVDRVANEANAELVRLNERAALINENKEAIEKAEGDIFQLRLDVDPLKTLPYQLSEFKDEVKYSKASAIEVSVNPLSFVTTFKLLSHGGAVISTAEIDLPLESMIVDAKYNPASGGAIVLTLQSGSIIAIPVANIVRGLIPSSEKGAANGVASLDANGKVPQSQLPDNIGGINPDEYLKVDDVNIAVKDGVTKNPIPLTDEEKASACDWLGAIPNPKPAASSVLVFSGSETGAVKTYGYTVGYPYQGQFYRLAAEMDGDTIQGTGYFLVNDPTRPYHAANKKYVDDLVGDIESVLDSVITLQNSLVGGNV